MDADDDRHARILGFELGEIRKNMDAIDAAERQEIEEDDAALEVFDLDGRSRFVLGDVEQSTPPVSWGGDFLLAFAASSGDSGLLSADAQKGHGKCDQYHNPAPAVQVGLTVVDRADSWVGRSGGLKVEQLRPQALRSPCVCGI
ncbi:MAG: hypothetical protein U0744_18035 [Gemmataceae bacterium]